MGTADAPRRIPTGVAAAVLGLAVLAVAGCGGGSPATAPADGTAAAVAAASSSAAAPSGDVLACQHFVQQGQKLKSEATPSLTDLALAGGWVGEDAALAETPALKAAFTADSKAITDLLGAIGDTTAQQDAITKRGDDASAAIRSMCARVGVTVPAT